MNRLLTPLKGWRCFAWAVFWYGLACLLTFLFWKDAFQYAPFMLFFAAVAITAARSGPWLGMAVALAGVAFVLSQETVEISKMWIPAVSMLFNAEIIVFFGSVVRGGFEAEREASEFRESIGNAVADFLWSCLPDGTPIYLNERMAAYAGMSLEEMKQQGWKKLIHADDLRDLSTAFAERDRIGEKFSWPVRLRKSDGTYRWFQCRAICIKNPAGGVVRWMGTSTDTHEQHLAELARGEALQREKEARIEVEAASRMKDEFLTTISHELRTPLNAVYGWLKLLRDPQATSVEIQEGLEIIDRNAHAQGKIVDDLLDMSSMLKGVLRLDLREMDFPAIVEMAIESAMPTAVAKGLSIEQNIATDLGKVRGDPVRLQQIVWNLIHNAMKFTPKGGRISASLRRLDSSVELVVSDTGEGIDPSFLPYVFERFRQADASVTRSHGGLGLGMAITRQLVELHGGSITAQSPGRNLGSTFRVLLPVAEPAEKRSSTSNFLIDRAEKKQQKELLHGAKILVIDDDEDTRVVVRQILESHRVRVTVARGASEGLEQLAVETDDPFIGVLCDLAMPQLSGYDFIALLRALSDERISNLPVLALTAFARVEDQNRALQAGFSLYISKPVEPADLLAKVATLLQTPAVAGDVAEAL